MTQAFPDAQVFLPLKKNMIMARGGGERRMSEVECSLVTIKGDHF